MQNGLQNGLKSRCRPHRQTGPQVRDGHRLAALRANTAAGLVRDDGFAIASAAERCGSNRNYVGAMLVLLDSGNAALVEKVLTGEVPLLAAARETAKLAKLTAAYKEMRADDLTAHLVKSNPAERAEAARALGPDVVWTQMILPLVEEDRQSTPTK